MKIKVDLDINLSAKATYRNGQVGLSVSGSMPYGTNRTANASIEGASDEVAKMFAEAFEALIAEQQSLIVRATQAAQAESLTVASRMGEL